MSEIWYYIVLLNAIIIGTPFALWYFLRERIEWLRAYDKKQAIKTIKRAVGLFYFVYVGVPFLLTFCSFAIVSLVELDIQRGFEFFSDLFPGALQVVTGMLVGLFLHPLDWFTFLFIGSGALIMFVSECMWLRIHLVGNGFTSVRILKMLGVTTAAIVVLMFVGVQILNAVLGTV